MELTIVMPAKASVWGECIGKFNAVWIPAFAGMTESIVRMIAPTST